MSKDLTIVTGYGLKLKKEDFMILGQESLEKLEEDIFRENIILIEDYENKYLFPKEFSVSICNKDGSIDISLIKKPNNELIDNKFLTELLKNTTFDYGLYTVVESS